MNRVCLDEILSISQETHVSYFERYGADILTEKSLYFTFLSGCYAEFRVLFGSSIDCNSAARCIFVCDAEDEQLNSNSILKSLSLIQGRSKIETMLETVDGRMHKFTDTSLWIGCSSFGDFYLNKDNIVLLRCYLDLGNLVDPVNGKIKWPRKSEKRQKVLAYVALIFEPHVRYSENEINECLRLLHDDYALLRRELVVGEFLRRMKDGSAYWLNDEKDSNG